MTEWLSKLLDQSSEFFAHRKGLLPLIGIGLTVLNLGLTLVLPPASFLVTSNLFLHIGIIVALFGLMLSWAL
ncbi:MAG: hypothetical protein RBS68_02920 [Anaerolineales bacterium]|jgi:hypothetical protein|nr:hypothetical protein [Anaerolineales bacterium]